MPRPILKRENYAPEVVAEWLAKARALSLSSLRQEVNEALGRSQADKWLRIYDLWNFASCDEAFGIEYPGRIPGQIVKNVVYYYTQEQDLVVDPFAGGGVTQDVCEAMNRRCLSYDLEPARDFIQRHDVTEGFPEATRGCGLIFMDPPYWTMKDADYVRGETSLSDVPLDEFRSFILNLAEDCFATVAEGGHIGFIIQNQTEKDLGDLPYIDWGFESYGMFLEAGFLPVRRMNVPLPTQQFQPYDVERAKEEKRMLGIVRDLFVMQKPAEAA